MINHKGADVAIEDNYSERDKQTIKDGPVWMSAKAKREALVASGLCDSDEDARIFLEDMGENEGSYY